MYLFILSLKPIKVLKMLNEIAELYISDKYVL